MSTQLKYIQTGSKTWRWVIGGCLFGLLVAGLVMWARNSPEPTFDQRTLSSWLEEWRYADYDRTNAAAQAIYAIGTNGLPFLLHQISMERSALQLKLLRVGGRYLPHNLNPLDRDAFRAVDAAEAINLLGPQAKPAFPVLTNLMTKPGHGLTAAIALAGMGEDGVAVLVTALTNQDWRLRSIAATALAEARTNFDVAIPALVDAVRMDGGGQGDARARVAAGSALARMHRSPGLVVPAFSSLLTNQDPRVRSWGANLLGGFGAHAREAIPLLHGAEQDSDPAVREAAQHALKEIDLKTSGN